MDDPIIQRYVVLGLVNDIESWRREQGLSRRQVIAVSTHGENALRGLTLTHHHEVVTLPSWSHASPRVAAEVERNLAIARLASKQPYPS